MIQTDLIAAPASRTETPLPRAIVHRTRGHRHGPITRLMSPGDLGQIVKPFVFLDLFEADSLGGGGFAPHPHSGLATHTTFLKGEVGYGDSTGQVGTLSDGSIEWMSAGSAVWHTGFPVEGKPILGYQLWVALPETLELSPPESQYLGADAVQEAGPVRLLLGQYQTLSSPIRLPVSLTYLHVRLRDGERWIYEPASDHDVAWLALNTGRLRVGEAVLQREMAVFEDGSAPIEVLAEGDVEFVIASSARHPHPLVTGSYSVHTSHEALAKGEANIVALSRTPAVQALHALGKAPAGGR
ncbi:Quercetin 2,3-dioxygenase [compost metagenome]